jgi:hypothetical protein
MSTSGVKGRSLPLLEVRDIPISRLVPGELFLEADAVDRVRVAISDGLAIESPRVTPMGEFFYVCDGNHRVMAMKLLGKSSIHCRIQPHTSSPNVADYKTDKFEEAVRSGHTGFVGVQMGSAEEKALAYEAEDELFDNAVLEGLGLDNESSDQIGENEEKDFFGDTEYPFVDQMSPTRAKPKQS